MPHSERMATPRDLIASEGVFLTLTSRGVVEAESIDATPLRTSPLTARLRQSFETLLEQECAAG